MGDFMESKRVFLTGASGCIGHYLAELLIQQTDYELYLLVRNPDKLKFNYQARTGINLLKGDLRYIERYTSLLKNMDAAVLIATAWGGVQETFDVNVSKTVRLVQLLNPEICEQVIYFSTASILDHKNKLLKEATQLGTEYIRSKYDAKQRLNKLKQSPPITTLYPTLVLGGDPDKPYSHLSSGLPEIVKWLNVIRWFKADGSFHFIHAYDIAQIVFCLLKNTPEPGQNREFVLGNSPLTANQAVAEACQYFQKKIGFQISLSPDLAELIINLLGLIGVKIQLAPWDRFCMTYRHFTYESAVNPTTFGLDPYCSTLTDALRIAGITSDRAK